MFIFNNSQRDLSNFLSQMFGQNNVNYVIVQKDYDDCKDCDKDCKDNNCNVWKTTTMSEKRQEQEIKKIESLIKRKEKSIQYFEKKLEQFQDELTRLYSTKNKILKNDLIERLNKREKLYYMLKNQIKVNQEEEKEHKEKALNELKEENRFTLKYFIDWQEVDKETYEKVKNWEDMTNHSFEEVKKTARFFIWDKEYSEQEFFEVLKNKKK